MSTELIFEGKKFILSRDAARISGYAPDYIGQLCRSGRLLARHIGRNWYVGEESLIHHKERHLNTDPLKALRLNGNGKAAAIAARDAGSLPSAERIALDTSGAPSPRARILPDVRALHASAASFPSQYLQPLLLHGTRAALGKVGAALLSASLVFGGYSFANSSLPHEIADSAPRIASAAGMTFETATSEFGANAASLTFAIRK